MLQLVGIPAPAQRVREYPHQLSGGMRQRVMIAIALSCDPSFLIADEPTTALDVTIEAQILELMQNLQRRLGMSIMFITHDLGVIGEVADEVVVMYAGKIAERGGVLQIFDQPRHPYTQGLLASRPVIGARRRLQAIDGTVPHLAHLPEGCYFASRCAHAAEICEQREPPEFEVGANHAAACWLGEAGAGDRPRAPAPAANGAAPRQAEAADAGAAPKPDELLLQVRGLKKHFPLNRGLLRRTVGWVRAVDGVSFEVAAGETVGLVGESGCGKSTTGRTILRLLDPTAGEVLFRLEGTRLDLAAMNDRRTLQRVRRELQIIFQDPFSSLDPRMTVRDIIEEPLRAQRIGAPAARHARVDRLLEVVGLNAWQKNRYPHEFSGGQRQRIGIARALAVDPSLLICDEPVSALDVSVQAQILNLLEDLQSELRLTFLFIAHDLSVVEHIADRVLVMYLGKIVEVATADDLYRQPRHPYTEALLKAIPASHPRLERKREPLQGGVPDPAHPPRGCNFHPRCPYAAERCAQEEPALQPVGDGGRMAACHYAAELALAGYH